MNLRHSFIFVLAITISFIGLSGVKSLFAQGLPLSATGVELTQSPESATPGQTVTITAASYVTDLNSDTISWTINGVPMKSGIGITSIKVAAPALGKTASVSVNVTTQDGQQFPNKLDLRSGSVDLIIETDGYTPPLFKGRLPVVYQNNVKIVAIPHIANSSGVEYLPSNLVYKWSLASGEVLADQSGYGKNFVNLKGSIIPRPYFLTVSVTTLDGIQTISGSLTVTPQKPEIQFYINDSLYGPLYNTAIGKIGIGTQKETSVVAVPYGFNKVLNSLGNLVLNWTINDADHSELNSNNVIVLRVPSGASGTSNVALSTTNKKEILQQANGQFTVNFADFSSSGNQSKSAINF